MLLKLIPSRYQHVAKSIVGFVGALLVVAPQLIDALPTDWQHGASAAIAVITGALVYFTPNGAKDADDVFGDDEVDPAALTDQVETGPVPVEDSPDDESGKQPL